MTTNYSKFKYISKTETDKAISDFIYSKKLHLNGLIASGVFKWYCDFSRGVTVDEFIDMWEKFYSDLKSKGGNLMYSIVESIETGSTVLVPRYLPKDVRDIRGLAATTFSVATTNENPDDFPELDL